MLKDKIDFQRQQSVSKKRLKNNNMFLKKRLRHKWV